MSLSQLFGFCTACSRSSACPMLPRSCDFPLARFVAESSCHCFSRHALSRSVGEDPRVGEGELRRPGGKMEEGRNIHESRGRDEHAREHPAERINIIQLNDAKDISATESISLACALSQGCALLSCRSPEVFVSSYY